MSTITRRAFLGMAAAMGATAAWGSAFGAKSHITWRERRDLFPEGVASGDPDSNSVLLWTRRPSAGENAGLRLTVEVAEDEAFSHVVATAGAPVSAASDWTCRVLVGGLKPSRVCIGTVSPIPKASAAAWAERSLRQPSMTRVPCVSFSSVARTRTREHRTPTVE